MMTFLEFFAGAGMARAGLGPDWRCLFANDIDVMKARSYAANWTNQGLVVGDVAALATAALPGRADLAWASFPCQDLSLAGGRAGLDGGPSSAFWGFWKLMQALRIEGRAPTLIVLENVVGLMTSHNGADFDTLCVALADDGYRVGTVMIDASHFLPQSRPRVFVVGANGTAFIPSSLLADGPMVPFHPVALVAAAGRQRNPIWWRLPMPPKRNSILLDIIENEPHGVCWHTNVETDRLSSMMDDINLAKLEAAKRAGRKMVGGLYRRTRGEGASKRSAWEVRFDGLAGCLRVPTGGSSRQTIVIVDGASVRSRLLSPREAARLMGLPDSYALPHNYNDAYGLMGDGVAVPAVRFLATHLLEPLVNASLL